MREPVRTELLQMEERLPRGLLIRTAWIVVCTLLLLCVIALLILRGRERALRPSMRFDERALPAPGRVATVREWPFQIAHPRPALKDAQRAALRGYGWVDRTRGIVRIPIERAMELRVAHAQGGAP